MSKCNVKIRLLILIFFIQLSINFSCKKNNNRKISTKELSFISESCPTLTYPINLYYLDGNCSLCLAKAKNFDDTKNYYDRRSVIMFITSNPSMTKIYIEGISLQSCIILDSSTLFAKSLSLNTIYNISKKGEILSESTDKKVL